MMTFGKLVNRIFLHHNTKSTFTDLHLESLFCCSQYKITESGYLSWYSDRLHVRKSGFDSRQGHEFVLLHSFQTG
jgi:hypothetical protein